MTYFAHLGLSLHQASFKLEVLRLKHVEAFFIVLAHVLHLALHLDQRLGKMLKNCGDFRVLKLRKVDFEGLNIDLSKCLGFFEGL